MPLFSKISTKTALASMAGRLSTASARVKAKVGHRLPRGSTVVTGIKLSATAATTLGLSVPYMKGIAEAANEIVKYSNAMKTNRKECKKLAARCEELMGALLAATEGLDERDLSVPMSLCLAELEWNLEKIVGAMDKIRHDSFLRRLLSNDEHASQLGKHREDLENVLSKFKVMQSVRTSLEMARMEKKQDTALDILRTTGGVGEWKRLMGLGGIQFVSLSGSGFYIQGLGKRIFLDQLLRVTVFRIKETWDSGAEH